MPLLVTVAGSLAEAAILPELKQFVGQAERIGADPDVELLKHDDNLDPVELEAAGFLYEPAG